MSALEDEPEQEWPGWFAPPQCGKAWQGYGDLTERQHAYAHVLIALREMTEEELYEAVAQLPQEIRDRLARGPHPARFTCAVCNAFGKGHYKTVWPDADDPAYRAFAYHEVPKGRANSGDDQHHGALANETYERCIATYRAAGWKGVAAPADA